MIFTQYCIENKRLDAYFSNYKLRIEVDEYTHEGRNSNYEKSAQLMIESHGMKLLLLELILMLQILTCIC